MIMIYHDPPDGGCQPGHGHQGSLQQEIRFSDVKVQGLAGQMWDVWRGWTKIQMIYT